MNHFIYFMFLLLLFIVFFNSGSTADKKNIPTSPYGPYKMVFKQTYSVNSAKNNKFQYDFYLSHRDNKTIIFGNTTIDIPFDDTFSLGVKIASKDSSGRWKENSLMQRWPNACSNFKKILGNAFTACMYGLGINHTDCPLPVGFYTASGMDTSILKNSNLPKTFLYGTYKVYFYVSQKNEIVGGQVFILELKRP